MNITSKIAGGLACDTRLRRDCTALGPYGIITCVLLQTPRNKLSILFLNTGGTNY